MRLQCLLALICMLAVPFAAKAQPQGVHRLGFLSPASPPTLAARVESFKQGLADLGYREGRNYTIEYRWADGKDERLPAMAAELARMKVALILVHGVQPAQAVQKASQTIPIVCFVCGDVLGTGLVGSLARPGGNLTGVTSTNPATTGKRLELLKEAVPGLAKVALLWNSRNAVSSPEVEQSREAARALGLQVQSIGVADPGEYAVAFESMKRAGAQGLVIISDATFYGKRRELAELAQAQSIPAIAWTGDLANEGILLGYGPDGLAQSRRAADYVDRILRGARPAELPMEQPLKYELRVNLRTAGALKLSVPRSLIIRADQVIQ